MTPRKRSLAELPPEIISQIISHAPSAQFLGSLARTSRTLNQIVEADGWNAFVTNRFPSIPVPPYWKDAAHALTTLSRNFDRRAFIAQDLGPEFGQKATLMHELPSGVITRRWNRPRSQTMGYQPVIDSFEQWIDNRWDSRREIVAWGAGAGVVAQIVKRGQAMNHDQTELSTEKRDFNHLFDRSGSTDRVWLSYRQPEYLEGRDDITAINIVKQAPRYHDSNTVNDFGDTMDLIVGRASGGLEMLRLWEQGAERVKTFDSGNLGIRSADVSSGDGPLVAACLGDTKLALYPVNGEEQDVRSISETASAGDISEGIRSWSTRFLCHDKLAVGRGISSRIVHVYSIRPDGLSDEPVRSFGNSRGNDRRARTSAYPVEPVPSSSMSHDAEGDLFYSGGHDGDIRLHDMRSSLDCEAILSDTIDNSAIFSLATVGRERLIAGAASHRLLKVFDLRMTGGRRYFYREVEGESVELQPTVTGEYTLERPRAGFNTYVRIASSGRNKYRGGTESPVYSLSRPSQSSTSLYVGTENTVSHFNFTSMEDQHPDPVFRNSLLRMSQDRVDASQTWDPRDNVVDLHMYERVRPSKLRLLTQKRTYATTKTAFDPNVRSRLEGYDIRWSMP